MRLSIDEWFDLPEGEPGELVNGRLEEEEEPDYLHELLVSLLIQILGPRITPRGGLAAGSNASGRLDKIPGCEGLTLDLDALWTAIDSLE